MKYVALFAILFVGNLLQSQTYLNGSSTWYQEDGYYDFSCCMHHEVYVIKVVGDTMLNGLSYFKLRKIGIDSISEGSNLLGQWMPPRVEQIDENYGLIREEEGKFYHKSTGTQDERLIYDFTVNIGDVLSGINGLDCASGLITDIDTVVLGGTALKRFSLEGAITKVIEGIGNTGGLLGRYCQGFESGGTLNCYQKGKQVFVVNSIGCDLSIAVDTYEEEGLKDVILYPNPSLGQINITGLSEAMTDYWAYDMSGKLVQQGELLEKQLYFNQPGVYFLKFRNENLWYVKKLVIID